MTNYVIEPAQQVSLPVRGSDAVFPVRRIYCIGRNYADHAIEMGHDPDKEPPFFFQKNAENVDTSGEFPYPPQTSDVHFEMEMIVALKSGGVDIREEDALDHVFGYGLGLDMPISKFGCFTAAAGVIAANSPIGKVKNGPPDAVRQI